MTCFWNNSSLEVSHHWIESIPLRTRRCKERLAAQDKYRHLQFSSTLDLVCKLHRIGEGRCEILKHGTKKPRLRMVLVYVSKRSFEIMSFPL